MRRVVVGGIGPLVHPYKWLRPDMVPPLTSLQCGVDYEFRKACLPFFFRSVQREVSLEEFDAEVDDWLPLLPEIDLPPFNWCCPFECRPWQGCCCL